MRKIFPPGDFLLLSEFSGRDRLPDAHAAKFHISHNAGAFSGDGATSSRPIALDLDMDLIPA